VSKITSNTFAKLINQNCHQFKYFWAAGLIKETLGLWKHESNYTLLCPVARTMVNTYNQ